MDALSKNMHVRAPPLDQWQSQCLQAIADSLPDFCSSRTSLNNTATLPLYLVGVSGGADSMALVLLMLCLQRHYRFRLAAAIVDHGIRDDSASEAAQVQAALNRLDVLAVILKNDDDTAAAGMSLSAKQNKKNQEWARSLRFDLLLEHAQNIQASALLLAHHCKDQAETVLDRLARGSHVLGLSAMRKRHVRGGINIVRPLLDQQPEDLRCYCQWHGVNFVDDPSNSDTRYRRVQIRQMLKCKPSLVQAALRLQQVAAGQANQELQAAGRLAQQCVTQPYSGVVHLQYAFASAPDLVQWRLCASILRYVAQSEYTPRYAQIKLLCAAMTGSVSISKAGRKPFRRRTLGGVVIAANDSGWLLYREAATLPSAQTLAAGQSLIWDNRYRIHAHRTLYVRVASRDDLRQGDEHASTRYGLLWRMPHLSLVVESVEVDQHWLLTPRIKDTSAEHSAFFTCDYCVKKAFGEDLSIVGLPFGNGQHIY